MFIHDALDELITCGETSFSVQNVRVKLNRMSKEVPGMGKTGFQDQFEVRAYAISHACFSSAMVPASINVQIFEIPITFYYVSISTSSLGTK